MIEISHHIHELCAEFVLCSFESSLSVFVTFSKLHSSFLNVSAAQNLSLEALGTQLVVTNPYKASCYHGTHVRSRALLTASNLISIITVIYMRKHPILYNLLEMRSHFAHKQITVRFSYLCTLTTLD